MYYNNFLTKLRYLDLADNNLNTMISQLQQLHLFNFSTIETLSLEKCYLNDLDLHAMCHPRAAPQKVSMLTHLNLGDNDGLTVSHISMFLALNTAYHRRPT